MLRRRDARLLHSQRDELAARNDLSLGIFVAVDGNFLDDTGLHRPEWTFRALEIGYWLRAAAVGHGSMSEEVRQLSTFAFAELHANRVEVICDATDERSHAVAERSGFHLEGRLRRTRLDRDGRLSESLVFSLEPTDEQTP